MRKLRLFYMDGLRTPLAQKPDQECYKAMKRVCNESIFINDMIPTFKLIFVRIYLTGSTY